MDYIRNIDDDCDQLKRDILHLARQYRLAEECIEEETALMKELCSGRDDLRARLQQKEAAFCVLEVDAKDAKAQRDAAQKELQEYCGSTCRLINDISKFISELIATDAWQEMPEYVVMEHMDITRRIADFMRLGVVVWSN